MCLAVGAAFDFHAGLLRQAPRWMQRAGLEWAFRLAVEPRRLWRRYAKAVPRFLAGDARERMRGVPAVAPPRRAVASNGVPSGDGAVREPLLADEPA